MTTIPGKPEGRPGIWLVTAATAKALFAAVEDEHVHCFLGSFGADWDKVEALEFVDRQVRRWALVFPPNQTIRHHLVAIGDGRRWAFDVGEIGEARMQESDA